MVFGFDGGEKEVTLNQDVITINNYLRVGDSSAEGQTGHAVVIERDFSPTTSPASELTIGGDVSLAAGYWMATLDLGASTEAAHSIAVASSGTHPLIAELAIGVPSIAGSGANITKLATVYIEGAPAYSGGTIANGPYALWIDDGAVLLDGTLTVGGTLIANGTVTLTSPATVGTLTLASGSITDSSGAIDFGNENLTSTGVITGLTIEATGDTASGDNAAMGYTSSEGLILTGQGSVTDVIIKNDAGTTVISIATGTTEVVFAGSVEVQGNVGIGVAAPVAPLEIQSLAASMRQTRYSDTDVQSAGITIQRSRGTTVGTDVIVQSGDRIANFNLRGYDGFAYKSAASIEALIDGTPGTLDMPGRLVFSTTKSGASSVTEALRLDSSQNAIFAGNISAVGTLTATSLALSSFLDFTAQAIPADPSTGEARMYLDAADSNNDSLYVAIKKNGAFVEVELTSPHVWMAGASHPSRDPEVDIDDGKIRMRLYNGRVFEADLDWKEVLAA